MPALLARRASLPCGELEPAHNPVVSTPGLSGAEDSINEWRYDHTRRSVWSQLTHRCGAQNEQRRRRITALDDQEPRTPLLCADDVAYRLRAARGRKREPGLHGTWGYLCFVWWQRVCQHT